MARGSGIGVSSNSAWAAALAARRAAVSSTFTLSSSSARRSRRPVCVQKRRVRRSADNEAVRDGQPGALELAQIRALAAGVCDVVAAEARKRTNRVKRGLHGGCG